VGLEDWSVRTVVDILNECGPCVRMRGRGAVLGAGRKIIYTCIGSIFLCACFGGARSCWNHPRLYGRHE